VTVAIFIAIFFESIRVFFFVSDIDLEEFPMRKAVLFYTIVIIMGIDIFLHFFLGKIQNKIDY